MKTLGIIALVVGIEAAAFTGAQLYLQYEQDHPATVRSVEVITTIGNEINDVLTWSNCNVTANTASSGSFITGIPLSVYVAVVNNGNTAVTLRQITVTTNITSTSSVEYSVPPTKGTISQNSNQVYGLSVNIAGWPDGSSVALHVGVSGLQNVSGSDVITLVPAFGWSNTNNSTSSSTTSIVTTSSNSTVSGSSSEIGCSLEAEQ
jgi:hypothetical protein